MAELTHIVFTRERSGITRIYLNGKQSASAQSGRTSGSNNNFHLSLANELTGDRPWSGEFQLIAIYGKAF